MLVRLKPRPGCFDRVDSGRATGVGSELALACDMRFASREKAILSHFEVGPAWCLEVARWHGCRA